MRYEKPIVLANDELSEGVYMASGSSASGEGGLKCDSIYMLGVFQAPDYSTWGAGETRGYKQQFGCLGCRAYRAEGCGLQLDYVDSGYASSYDSDDGLRKPGWESKGYGPNDPVTDWDVGSTY